MQKNNYLKIVSAAGMALVAMVMFNSVAFAGQGKGYGRFTGDDSYYGRYDCGRGGYGQGKKGYRGRFMEQNLSPEEIEKLNQAREKFFEATRDLKLEMRQKQLELRAELAKKEPDTKRAFGLQKEISQLKSQFDQKRLEHRLEVKKINPYLGMQNRGPRGGEGFKGMRGGFGGQGQGPRAQ